MQKLQGKGRSGDSVHRNQKMAADAGFKNVSKRWLDKTMGYQEGLAALEDGKAKTEDIVAAVGHVDFVARGSSMLVKFQDGRAFRPTSHAITQLSSWSGVGKWYATSLTENPENAKGKQLFARDGGDAETLAAALRNGFRRMPQEKNLFWRTRDDGTLRALLSERYAEVPNEWFVKSLEKLVPGGRLSHWRGDSDTIYGNILIPDSLREESDSEYGGMVSVGNSEIGERRISSVPSVFRAICQNGCIWDQVTGKGIRKKHLGEVNLDQLFMMMKENLEKQIPLLPQGIERLLGTRRMGWDGGSVLPLFAATAAEYGFSKKQATSLLTAYHVEEEVAPETAPTLFGVIASITRAGQKLDNASWIRFDEIGGRLSSLDGDDWAALTGKAKRLKTKQVESAFAS